MGSVRDLYTTGDNDPEIEPVQYYRHHLYCDSCGSFELDSWMAPHNAEALERTRQWLWKAACLLSPVLVVAAGLLALALDSSLGMVVLVDGLLVVAGLLVVRAVLGSRIHHIGMRCRQCDATYANGAQFFTDLSANPRNLTMADVPRPLSRSSILRGESVDCEVGEA